MIEIDKVSAVIFDMDGLIVDAEPVWHSAEKEIFGNFTKVDCKPVIGFRPISFDGKPMIGPLNKDIFVATGTKRDGLTLSPLIVDYVLNWLKNDKFISNLRKIQGLYPKEISENFYRFLLFIYIYQSKSIMELTNK